MTEGGEDDEKEEVIEDEAIEDEEAREEEEVIEEAVVVEVRVREEEEEVEEARSLFPASLEQDATAPIADFSMTAITTMM